MFLAIVRRITYKWAKRPLVSKGYKLLIVMDQTSAHLIVKCFEHLLRQMALALGNLSYKPSRIKMTQLLIRMS